MFGKRPNGAGVSPEEENKNGDEVGLAVALSRSDTSEQVMQRPWRNDRVRERNVWRTEGGVRILQRFRSAQPVCSKNMSGREKTLRSYCSSAAYILQF